MDISLCIIVKNEGKHLQKMLNSVKNICKEICAVDTGSTDNTLQILQNFNANIKEIKWKDDFSYARNVSLSMATQPWILYLDGDEWFDQDYRQVISNFISKPNNGAAYMERIDYFDNGNKNTTMLLRLFRNLPDIKFRFKIHEDLNWSLFPKLKEKNLAIQNLDCLIHHIGYTRSDCEEKKKDERDIRILKTCIEEEPNHWYNYHKIIEILVNKKNEDFNHYKQLFLQKQSDILNDETENYFISCDDKHQKMYLSKLLFTVTSDMMKKDQLHYLLKSSIRFHLLSSNTMNFYLGFIYEKLRKKKSAGMYYRKCINNKLGINNMFHILRPSLGLTRLHLSNLNFKEAKQYFDIAYKINPIDKEVIVYKQKIFK